jgi:small subunit ribosomal protein S17
MADETPDNPQTPETLDQEVETAAAQGGTPVPGPAQTPSSSGTGEPEVQLPPKERRAARRAAKAPAPSGPKTIEERQALRVARRQQKAKLRRNYRARLRAQREQQRAVAPPAEPVEAHEHGPGRPKVRQGIVVSDKADKTIVVRVDIAKRHRRYGKIMRTSSRLHVHDEANDANTGDTVRVVESRPLSATKRWRLTDVLERAK